MVDPIVNKGKVTVSTGYNSTATSIVLATGQGAELPDPVVDGAYNLPWYDSTNYNDPADDPNYEIVRVTGPAGTGDTKTIVRAQEGTAATNKNNADATYKMHLGVTAKTITDLIADVEKCATVIVGKSGHVDYLTTDYGSDSACIQAAIDYVNGLGGGSVLIREGTYTAKFDVKANVSVSGVGNSTIIQFPNTSYSHAIYIYSNSAIRNMKLDGGLRRAGLGDVNACYLYDTTNDIENVFINNITFYKTGPSVQIVIGGTNNIFENILISDCMLYNTTSLGSVEKGDATNTTRNITYHNCKYRWVSESKTISEWFDFNGCDDVTLDSCEIIADNTLTLTDEAIDMGGTHNRCSITNNKFIGNFQRFIKVGYKCRDILIEGNYSEYISGTTTNDGGIIIWNNGSLVADNHPERVRIIGNHVKSMDTGIALVGTFRNVVSGNIIEECDTGIKLNKDTSGGASVDCQYNTVSNNVIIDTQVDVGILVDIASYNTISNNVCVDTQGSPTMTYGIRETSSGANNTFLGNMSDGAITAEMSMVGLSVGNITPPSVPATTVNYTNQYGGPCQVQIYGGTVTEINIDDIATGVTSGIFYIPYGGTINITYSAAPSWRWWRL